MTWRSFVNTITAIWLVTLPGHALGQACVEREWSKLLIEQKRLDSWYNQHAEKFNQFLDVYQRQVFLHRQFSSQQIASFWSPNKPDLQQKMRVQIASSGQVATFLQQEIEVLQRESSQVSNITERWQMMKTACENKELAVNVVSSQHYLARNLELSGEITLLTRKLQTLRQTYLDESRILSQAEPQQKPEKSR